MAASDAMVQALAGSKKRAGNVDDTGYPVFSGAPVQSGPQTNVESTSRILSHANGQTMGSSAARQDLIEEQRVDGRSGSRRAGSTCRPEADWCEELLAGLQAVPPSERARECATRREELREAVAQMDKVLSDSNKAVRLQPSKYDKQTAGTYHTCFRHLHWALDRCRQLQEAAASIEDYDSDRLYPVCMLEYALLGADIVARHDYASRLLSRLCGPPQSMQQQLQRKEAAEEAAEAAEAKRGGTMSDWLMLVVAACGSRVCMTSKEPPVTSECSRQQVGSH